MGDSEDEFRPLPAGGLRRRRRLRGPEEGGAEGGAAAQGPPPPPHADAAAATPPAPPGPGHACSQHLGAPAPEQRDDRCPDAAPARRLRPGPASAGLPPCPLCGQRFSAAKSRRGHLKRCAARLDVAPAVLLQALRRQQEQRGGGGGGGEQQQQQEGGAGAGAVVAAPSSSSSRGPGLPPAPSGLKRKGASSAEPRAKKPKKAARLDGTDEDLLLAVAMSRSLQEEEAATATFLAAGRQGGPSRGRKLPRAGKKSRVKPARSPPPLLLQDPEKARREMEQRVALLLPEAEEFPSTPPLPGSHLALPKGGQQRTSLWEFSSLAGPCAAAGSFCAVGLHLPLPPRRPIRSPVPGSPPEAEPVAPDVQPFRGTDRGDLLQGSMGQPRERLACSQEDTGALQDLMELAGEGLTLTQWGLEVQQLQGAGQEPAAEEALQSRSVRSLEKKKKEKPSPRSHPARPLDSLAAAFRGMVNNPHLSDIQFQVDSGELFYAHLFVVYARCPQLMEMADRQGFAVAEDGAAKTCRVLLNDVPGEAVRVFLNYLYASDHAVPRHVLPDVAALAKRFGAVELAALCGDPPGPGVSGREEEEEEEEEGGEGGTAATEDDGDDRAETFEELLKSMWLDEDEDAPLAGAHQGSASTSRDHVTEPELQEIYAFAATQRRAAPGGAEEERGSRQGQQKEVGGRGPPRGAWSRKGLEEPPAAMATGERQEERGVRGEGAVGQLPLEAQQDAEEMRPPRASARGSSPAQALLGWVEASRQDSSPELPGAWEESPKSPPARERSAGSANQDTVSGKPPSPLQGPPKDLRPAQGLFPSDRHGLVLPVDDSPPGSSAGVPSHACSLLPSASQLPCTAGRPSSSQDGQQGHTGSGGRRRRKKSPEGPGCGPRPLRADSEAALIVVLDSDEEVKLGQGTDLRLSGPRPGAPGHRPSLGADVSGGQGPSPHPYRVTAVPLLATLVCEEAGSPLGGSPWLWGLSSGEDGGSYGEGRTVLALDTPPLSRLGAKLSGTPGPREQRLQASPAALPSSPRPFLDRPCLQRLLSACDRPLSLPSAACSPGSGPSPLDADVVVVVDDSEEEPEAALLFPGGPSAPGEALPAAQEEEEEEAAGGPRASVGPGSQLRTVPRSEGGRAEGCPLVAGSAVAGRAAVHHFGKASSWEPERAGWAGEGSDDSSEGPRLPLTQALPASMALQETPPGLACRDKGVPRTTPLTPMPFYSAMETPKLKKELSRFGVRALPKRQMVLKLKEIFQYTHPKVGADCQAWPMPSRLPPPHSPAKTDPRTVRLAPASSTPQKQRPGFCQRFPGRRDPSGGGDQGCGQMAEPCRSQAGSGQPKGTALSAARFPVGGSVDCLSLPASQESTGSSVASSEASVTSQSSSSADFESSALAAEEDEEEEWGVPSSQAAAREAQKLVALQHYLRSKPELQRQILLYQPIELAVLQAELKQNGITIALSKLLDFLDARCITFTTAEARREKQHRRRTKKKGRRRL